MMRRLYSSFPKGWPGLGLLLLRLAQGVPSTVSGGACLWNAEATPSLSVHALDLATGGFLIIGLWTPIAATFQAAADLYRAFATSGINDGQLVRALIGISLALLGPGAWSVDARLFGRRRIDVGRLDE